MRGALSPLLNKGHLHGVERRSRATSSFFLLLLTLNITFTKCKAIFPMSNRSINKSNDTQLCIYFCQYLL
jgi:hypothetical protein